MPAVQIDCPQVDVLGRSWVEYLSPTSAEPASDRQLRDYLSQEGIKMGKQASLGDYVVVELAWDIEPILVGRLVRTVYTANEDAESEWMGTIKKGDELIESAVPGSNYYDETEDRIAI